MDYKAVIDLGQLAESLNVPEGFMEVGDKKIPMRCWTADKAPAVAEAARSAQLPGEPLAIVGVAPSWVLGAAAAAVYPTPVVFYVPVVQMAFQVERLPIGGFSPEGEVRFTVTDCGEAVCVDFMSDDPSKPFDHGPHNYDYSNITKVRIPAVEPGKKVLISGRGAFPVALSIETGYIANGNSVWMRYQNEKQYTCVYGAGMAEAGDQIPNPAEN